ncbi:S-adenosylmethionine-dependent methyltransferase domain-containing protein [Engraulis encrasicolus]|uniref:S-adenosylmethionine-dependent methyltransferase domain-containing protein n=1 Tax=Engraulis encrasicolus TaxID=184585 RepID=UPI002FD6A109
MQQSCPLLEAYLGKPSTEGMEYLNYYLVTKKEQARCLEEDSKEEEDLESTEGLFYWEKLERQARMERKKKGGEKIRTWEPNSCETFNVAGHDISIKLSLDSYGALIWPAARALCEYLQNNKEEIDLMDKAVLEIGAGTGLVSIVSSLLGAWVTSSDLPDILGNLRYNLSRNTRGRCRYTPQVAAMAWGHNLQRNFPHQVFRYDYVLAADVVYHHDCLDELLATMEHFCRPNTTLIWANKVRFESDQTFIQRFKDTFDTTVLAEVPEEGVFIFKATFKTNWD